MDHQTWTFKIYPVTHECEIKNKDNLVGWVQEIISMKR